jgi:hypothetical protein
MPPVNKKLDANVKVSVSKRFITDNTVKTILLREHDWNETKTPVYITELEELQNFEVSEDNELECILERVKDIISLDKTTLSTTQDNITKYKHKMAL